MKKAKSSTHRTSQSQELEQMDYRGWKARCAAPLERQGIFSGAMRERERRQLFINSATPEQPRRGAGRGARTYNVDATTDATTVGRLQ
jgi:hypothetical protein